MEAVAFKANGKDFVGKVGGRQIGTLEKEYGAAIYNLTDKMGVGFIFKTLFLGVQKMDASVSEQNFETDFDAEMEANGLGGLAAAALEMIKNTGLGKEGEKKT